MQMIQYRLLYIFVLFQYKSKLNVCSSSPVSGKIADCDYTGWFSGLNVSICVNVNRAVVAELVCWVNFPWIKKKTKYSNVTQYLNQNNRVITLGGEYYLQQQSLSKVYN